MYDYYSVEETQEIIGVSKVTIYKYLEEGKLEGKQNPNRQWAIEKNSIYNFIGRKYIDEIRNLDKKTLQEMAKERFFFMKIKSGKYRDRTDHYLFFRNPDGWLFWNTFENESGTQSMSSPYPCQIGKDGDYEFISLLQSERVPYPITLEYVMKDLWEKIADNGLNRQQKQQMFTDVEEWINSCLENLPKFYK
ncbi:MAG: helix-turn-helix domain-containing protein [Promethearchaeota archaeon]